MSWCVAASVACTFVRQAHGHKRHHLLQCCAHGSTKIHVQQLYCFLQRMLAPDQMAKALHTSLGLNMIDLREQPFTCQISLVHNCCVVCPASW